MTLLSWNAESLLRASRESELRLLLRSNGVDVAAITEAEVPKDVIVSIPGYSTIYAPADGSGKVRLLMLLKNELAASAEVLAAEVTDLWVKTGDHAVVGGVYRRWNANEEEDLTAIHSRAEEMAAKSKLVAVMGDFNLDMKRMDDASYSRSRLLSCHREEMEGAGYHFRGPWAPTYFSHGKYGAEKQHRESWLDHVYVAGSCADSVYAAALPNATTDHRPILAHLPISNMDVASDIKCLTGRNWKKATISNLIQEFDPEAISRVFYSEDVDEAVDIIVTEVTRVLDVVAPVKSTIVKNREHPFSLAPDTRQAMRQRDFAAKHNRSQYRQLRNKAARLARRDKMRGAATAIESCSGDSAKLWKLANTIMGKAKGSAMPNELLDLDGNTVGAANLPSRMNQHYSDKVIKIRGSIASGRSACPSGPHATCPPSEELRFTQPSEKEILSIMNRMKSTSALGSDGIPALVWKEMAPVLAGPLAWVVGLSFKAARVPKSFKLAHVTPVHKGKGKSRLAMDSYRPVSVLPAISKVLEAAAMARLSPFLKKRLPGQQYGFRSGRNTAQAIGLAHGTWAKAVAAGRSVAVAAFDYTAAFDTLDVEILVEKLATLGIRGREQAWLQDYLTGRSQCLKYNGAISSPVAMEFGVPQGSILGPVLFTCLVADLPAALEEVDTATGDVFGGAALFADDVVTWSTGRTREETKHRLEQKAATMVSYSATHKLALNASKTQLLWSSRGIGNPSVLKIGATEVSSADTLEMLGVAYDRALTSAPYIKKQLAAAKAIRGTVRRLALHIPRGTLLQTVARSLVAGKLGYAAAAAYPVRYHEEQQRDGPMADLQVIVNDIARSLLGKRRQDRVTVSTLLDKTGLPSLNRLTAKSLAVETWKAATGINKPDPLSDLLGVPGSTGAGTRAATAQHIPPPMKKSSKTFVWEAHKLWNSLAEIRSAKTMSSAKAVATNFARTLPV